MKVRFDELEKAKEYLLAVGFHEFQPPKFSRYDSVAACFQKKYIDNNGIRYFVDANVWDFTWAYQVPDRYVVEFSGQFYSKLEHEAVNMEFIGWELCKVEDFINSLFDAGLLDYYEEYNDD